MRRSIVRTCGLSLALLALPVFTSGVATAASTGSSSAKLASASLAGDGSTFQKGFNDVAIGYFKQLQKAVSISYQGTGSGQGRTDFANKVVDFAGTDAPYAAGTAPADAFLYFPTVVAPITVSYNVSGLTGLKLSADTIAKIFQGTVTTWNDDAIKTDNPRAKLPSTSITVVHRSDGSGTTQNFTNFLVKAAPTTWTLGTGSTVQWPASTQGASGNGGVAQLVKATDGAFGYVDFSDAVAGELTYASIKNAGGKYIKPTTASASLAAQGTTVNADLTYDPINATGAAAYPITSPTWIMVYANQTDPKKGAALKAFLTFILGAGANEGQSLSKTVDYAPLPKTLLAKAKAQLSKVVVPPTS
jgi:phosphate transport system substrate-binding protein